MPPFSSSILVGALLPLGVLSLVPIGAGQADNPQPEADKAAFDRANGITWKEAFYDSCTDDWTQRWFLDGEIAYVRNSAKGMQMTAGPQFRNNAHHMVLWTKDSFEGDLKIEYEYTRLDFECRCVNILYIQATGSGEGPYKKDISEWSELRKEPAMKMYFNHMNLYHVSYAAFGNDDDSPDEYVRARRYMPGKGGLGGTDLEPDYFHTGLWEPGVPHKIAVIKRGNEIFMRVENAEQTRYFHWTNPGFPPITEGRIGLRQMFTRSARYKGFRISQPEERE